MSSDTSRPATRVIHTGEGSWPDAAPLTAPIYQTSTFLFSSAEELRRHQAGEAGQFIYSRYGNPTVVAAEEKLAVLHGAEAALLFGSGMAAVSTTILGLASAGDEVLCCGAIYGNTLGFLTQVATRLGLAVRFLSIEDTREPSRAFGPRTRLLWFESPINPTLRCLDIAAVARACRARGVVSVIDSTFASPVNQRPLERGVDLVMESATKYLGGHSDVTAGMVAGRRTLLDPLRTTRRLLGTVIEAGPAWLLARSLKSVDVRVRRHNENAMAVARWLAADPRVSRVLYPGLPGHPDHEIARAQMDGFGGMVTFDLDGSYDRAARLFDRLRVFRRAASLGGVESLCSLPVLTSQYGWDDQQLARAEVTRGMVRLSVGLEDQTDLIADLDQALD